MKMTLFTQPPGERGMVGLVCESLGFKTCLVPLSLGRGVRGEVTRQDPSPLRVLPFVKRGELSMFCLIKAD